MRGEVSRTTVRLSSGPLGPLNCPSSATVARSLALPLPSWLFLSPFQSVLESAGPQAGRIEWLWWVMLFVLSAVYLIVMALLVYATFRSRRPYVGEAADVPDTRPPPDAELRKGKVVAGGIAATVTILFVLLVSGYLVGRDLNSLGKRGEEALTVKVTGHQWWWEVTYDNKVSSYVLTTANEIRIPVGRPVLFKLTSTDVIHSFWVPNLHGKTDLIPGHETTTWVRADRPGTYRGQCGEFCGHQHAHMAFVVVAEPPEQFKAWYDAQLAPARQPETPEQTRGQQVFLSSPCVNCHRIRGTEAGGSVAPDLTHLASRGFIAAGTLENTRGHLAGWVVDSQKIKPGNRMPPNNLEPGDLHALLDYLQNLK